jgi:hypothetical protein
MLTVQDLMQFSQYIATRKLGKLQTVSKPFRWLQNHQTINPVTDWYTAVTSLHNISLYDFMTEFWVHDL